MILLQLSDDWNIDAPSYKWTKLDIDNEDDKKKISDYLMWKEDLTYNDKKFEDGELFL